MASGSGTLSPEPRPLRDSPLLPAGAQVRRLRLHYPQPGECFSLCSPSCLFPFPGCGLHAHVQDHAQRSISLLVRKLVRRFFSPKRRSYSLRSSPPLSSHNQPPLVTTKIT